MIKPSVKNEDAKKYVNSGGTELVIVKKDETLIYLVFENKELIDIEFEKENELPIGTKCVGKVSKIAKDINSAYILLPDKSTAFLRNIPADLKCEQNIPVEVTRVSSKGKLPDVQIPQFCKARYRPGSGSIFHAVRRCVPADGGEYQLLFLPRK